jgi:ABC-type polysaccharide/polyol phosphate transport system ATPase subunit
MELNNYVGVVNRVKVEKVSLRYRQFESANRSLKLALIHKSNRSSFRTKTKLALTDISFTLAEGEVLGIIGPNGAGKSSLLKCILGSLVPTQGFVETYGKVASLVDLSSGLNLDVPPKENLELYLSIVGLKTANVGKLSEAICEWADLTDVQNDPLRTYSSGMLARFAFSMITHQKPDILVIDEVLSVGDLNFQGKSLARTNNLAKSGCSVIVVSHDLETIRKMCSKGIYLKNGVVKSIGAPDHVINDYLLDSDIYSD